MSRRLVNITLDNLADLPTRCRSCVYWELDPVAGARARENGESALEKEAWISDTLLEWGSCGLLSYVDSVAAGYVLYAPPAYAARSAAFPTSPPSADAVLLMAARIVPEFRGLGLGRMLIQGVASEVSRRGIRAIEAFGRRDVPVEPDPAETPAGPAAATTAVEPIADPHRDRYECLMPASYLLAVGFKTVRPHQRTPRLRLDLKSTVSWREDVEAALERVLSSLHAPATLRH